MVLENDVVFGKLLEKLKRQMTRGGLGINSLRTRSSSSPVITVLMSEIIWGPIRKAGNCEARKPRSGKVASEYR